MSSVSEIVSATRESEPMEIVSATRESDSETNDDIEQLSQAVRKYLNDGVLAAHNKDLGATLAALYMACRTAALSDALPEDRTFCGSSMFDRLAAFVTSTVALYPNRMDEFQNDPDAGVLMLDATDALAHIDDFCADASEDFRAALYSLGHRI